MHSIELLIDSLDLTLALGGGNRKHLAIHNKIRKLMEFKAENISTFASAYFRTTVCQNDSVMKTFNHLQFFNQSQSRGPGEMT